MKTLRRAACCAAYAACAGCCVAVVAVGATAQGLRRLSRATAASSQPLAYLTPAGIGLRGGPVMLSQAPPSTTHPHPALEPARVAGELVIGAYAGIAGYFVGEWVAGGAADLLPAPEGTKDQIRFSGGLVGAGLTTAATVAAIGNIGDQTGSFPMTLAGTAAGLGIGMLLNQAIYGHAQLPSEGESSRMRWVEASLEAMLPSIGATIAFNSTRRYK